MMIVLKTASQPHSLIGWAIVWLPRQRKRAEKGRDCSEDIWQLNSNNAAVTHLLLCMNNSDTRKERSRLHKERKMESK